MKITDEIHTAIIAAERLKEAKMKLQAASNALNSLFFIGSSIMTDEERNEVRKTMQMIDNITISDNLDAEKYLKSVTV